MPGCGLGVSLSLGAGRSETKTNERKGCLADNSIPAAPLSPSLAFSHIRGGLEGCWAKKKKKKGMT